MSKHSSCIARAAVPLAVTLAAAIGCQSGFSIGGAGGGAGPGDRSGDRGDRSAERGEEPEEPGAPTDGDGEPAVADSDADDSSAEGTGQPEDRRAARSSGIDWCRRKVSLHGKSLATDDWAEPRIGFRHHTIEQIAHAGCSDRLTAEERRLTLAGFDQLAAWSKLPRAELSAYLAALVEGDEGPVAQACDRIKADGTEKGGLLILLGCQQAQGLQFPDDGKSALASAAVVQSCLSSDSTAEEADPAISAAKFALCGAEGRALDRKQIERELGSVRADKVLRTRVRIALRQIETSLAGFDRRLAGEYKRAPALRVLLHETADRAFAAGLEIARRNNRDENATFDYYWAITRREERPGCFVALRDRLVSMVRGAGARTIEEARKQMVGPAAYSTARALERCTRLDEQRRVYMQAVALELVTAPDTGSPRRAVLSAVLAGIQREGGPTPFRADDLDPRSFRLWDPYGDPSPSSAWQSTTAVIKKTSRVTGGTRVEFATESFKDEERECHDTNQVHSFRSDGSKVYFKTCGPWRSVIRRITQEPVVIPSEGAAGLAPGRPVEMYCLGIGEGRRCAAFAVWKDKHKKSLVALLGAPL